MAASDTIVRWRYRLVPDHLLGEILTKRWIDNAIPLSDPAAGRGRLRVG